eukprot:1256495-Alexandrium_andersonii.AAC.1
MVRSTRVSRTTSSHPAWAMKVSHTGPRRCRGRLSVRPKRVVFLESAMAHTSVQLRRGSASEQTRKQNPEDASGLTLEPPNVPG